MEGLIAVARRASSSDSELLAPAASKLRACKGCQRAKTACNQDERPCARCVRLKMDCDSDQPSVKTACTNCRRAKVKCIFREGESCTRCLRISTGCAPHVPIRKRKRMPAGAYAGAYVSQDDDGSLVTMDFDDSDPYSGRVDYDTRGEFVAEGVPPSHLFLAAQAAQQLSQRVGQPNGGAMGEGLALNLHRIGSAAPLLDGHLSSPALQLARENSSGSSDALAPEPPTDIYAVPRTDIYAVPPTDIYPLFPTDIYPVPPSDIYPLPADIFPLPPTDIYPRPRARDSASVPAHSALPAPAHPKPNLKPEDNTASRCPPAKALAKHGAVAKQSALAQHNAIAQNSAVAHHPARVTGPSLGAKGIPDAPACTYGRVWDSPPSLRGAGAAPAAAQVPPPVSASPLCYASGAAPAPFPVSASPLCYPLLCSGVNFGATLPLPPVSAGALGYPLCAGGALGTAAVGLLASAAAGRPARAGTPPGGVMGGMGTKAAKGGMSNMGPLGFMGGGMGGMSTLGVMGGMGGMGGMGSMGAMGSMGTVAGTMGSMDTVGAMGGMGSTAAMDGISGMGAYPFASQPVTARGSSTIDFGGALALASLSEAF